MACCLVKHKDNFTFNFKRNGRGRGFGLFNIMSHNFFGGPDENSDKIQSE